ncbi:hypothetical protein MUK42_13190 [Musa troglodytarum]|uniref:Uncharacterized protein n=1 Tax=Musa troglodytarum TaxID=320322 RepID=A0A9E7HG12_9LILI|nr:hypothetical protein MUK42_13190 [Musa troglodytarum]
MAKDAILGFLQADDEITDSHEFAAAHEVDHTELKNVIKGLNGFEGVEANPFQSPNPGNLRRTIIVLAKRGNCMRLKDSQTSTSSWPYLRRGFPWKMLRQDWIPRFSVLGHHGLKRMIEVRLPRDLYLESYHEGLKKWVDVGNSGMFTPEMVLPMHGVSLERC